MFESLKFCLYIYDQLLCDVIYTKSWLQKYEKDISHIYMAFIKKREKHVLRVYIQPALIFSLEKKFSHFL
jgi:hypothetical protein